MSDVSLMDLRMGRYDMMVTGPTRNNCIRVLPSAKAKRQKVVVGDTSGVLSCASIKSSQVNVVFQSQRREKGVTALCLGGEHKVSGPRDRIYAAYGQSVEGRKKKGIVFFALNTSLNQDVFALHMSPQDDRLWTVGGQYLNQLGKKGDAWELDSYYMSPADISSFCVLPWSSGGQEQKSASFAAILGCSDSRVRCVYNGEMVSEYDLRSPVTALVVYGVPAKSTDHIRATAQQTARVKRQQQLTGRTIENPGVIQFVAFGTKAGDVGVVCVDNTGIYPLWRASQAQSLLAGNSIKDRHATLDQDGRMVRSSEGSVNCLCVGHIAAGSNTGELIIGREDGNLEVWHRDPNGNLPQGLDSSSSGDDSVAALLWGVRIGESVTGVDCGFVLTMRSVDVVISTFSGKVIVFSQGGVMAKPIESKQPTSQSISQSQPDTTNSAVNHSAVSTAPQGQADGDGEKIFVNDGFEGIKLGAKDAARRAKQLRSEIAALKKKVDERKQLIGKVDSNKPVQSGDGTALSALKQVSKAGDLLVPLDTARKDVIPTEKVFDVKSTLGLSLQHSCYVLTVEIPVELGAVTLYSTAPIVVLECDSNEVTISTTHPKDVNLAPDAPQNAEKTAFKVRETPVMIAFTASGNAIKRLSVHLRTVEGCSGKLSVFVTSRRDPVTCQVTEYDIQPLAMHRRIFAKDAAKVLQTSLKTESAEQSTEESKSSDPFDFQEGPLKSCVNTLEIVGEFSVNQVHSWLGRLLRGVPSLVSLMSDNSLGDEPFHVSARQLDGDNKVQHSESSRPSATTTSASSPSGDTCRLFYQSVLHRSVFFVEYRKGRALFASQSCAVLHLIKSVISDISVQDRIAIREMNVNVSPASLRMVLRALRGMLDECFESRRRYVLVQPLIELQTQEDDVDEFLSPEYKDILNDHENITSRVERDSSLLDYLRLVLLSLFDAQFHLQGTSVDESGRALLKKLLNISDEQKQKGDKPNTSSALLAQDSNIHSKYSPHAYSFERLAHAFGVSVSVESQSEMKQL